MQRPRLRLAAALLAGLAAATSSLAVQPDEVLKDPALEARARELSRELRCMVCQNQSIDDSDAPLARDLRVLVRERLKAGDSNSQVIEFLTVRYGEYVLLNPVMAPHTLLLWIAGPVVLVGGAVVVLLAARRKRKVTTGASELTAEEAAALKELEGK